jgi:rhamnogalacturonyl hydrolase YesR
LTTQNSPKSWRRLTVVAFSILLAAPLLASQPKEFRSWPAGTSPEEVGKRVAERFVSTVQVNQTTAIYPAACAWYGALTFAQQAHDQKLLQQLIGVFDQQFTTDLIQFSLSKKHVDFSVFGAVPFQIYRATNDPKYLTLGVMAADHQWSDPTPEGLSGETRFWIDDMYMITILEVQAFRATGDAKYLDRAAIEMTAYLDKLQQPNGLFFHSPDAPFYWGRGNGWVAAGMTELLTALPASHPQRAKIISGYKAMMKSLLALQTQNGMWRQLLDHPEAWEESSSTAMFTFAMITGVKRGWLDEKTYGRAARKGWLSLVASLDSNGDLRNVCEGTGRKNDLDYYLARKRLTGDLHGQAPVLWCASALLQ